MVKGGFHCLPHPPGVTSTKGHVASGEGDRGATVVATAPFTNYKVLLFWICALFFLSSESILCQAQVKKFHGYVFSGVAGGAGISAPIVGGGAEVLIGGGFGIAADGVVYIKEGGDAALVAFLFGAIYMFHPERQTVPFARAGVVG